MTPSIKGVWGKLLLMGFCVALITGAAPAWAGPAAYTMGTGGQGGLYLPIGQAIAETVNQSNQGLSIKAEPSKGSIQNIQGLADGKFNLGIGQADVAMRAYEGELSFQKGRPYKGLRAIFGLHSENVTLVVSVKSDVKRLGDLKGKRVAMGSPGSGTLVNSRLALKAVGLKESDLGEAALIDPQQAVPIFKQGKLDAIFFTVGHPNELIKGLSKCKEVRILLLGVPNVVETVLLDYDYYVLGRVSTVDYPGVLNQVGVDTFGIKALLLVDEKAPDNLVLAVIKACMGNLSALKEKQRALSELGKYKMVEGITVPFHPAALKYYKQEMLVY